MMDDRPRLRRTFGSTALGHAGQGGSGVGFLCSNQSTANPPEVLNGMPIPRLRARLGAALTAALLLTGLAPAAPAAAPGPVKVHASELTSPVDGAHDFALPDGTTHIAIHWPGQPNAVLQAALSVDGTTFPEPMEVEIDDVGAARENGHTYGALMVANGMRAVRVTTDRPLPQVSVLALDAVGETTTQLGLGASAAASSDAAYVIRRSDWGADESLRFDDNGEELWTREYFPIQKLVVHHTAGANHDSNPAATVRAIYYYHAVTQGWGDIGYHYLIDDAGRVYEGRYSRDYPTGTMPTADDAQGRGVVAGHARGYNAGSLGFSVLGTYTSIAPTDAAQQSLVRMLAWASVKHGLDPRGGGNYVNPINGATLSTSNIAGHRDYNSTACPGGVFYALMPSIRNRVAAELVERFGGADRFGTAATISARVFPSAAMVLVANGLNFPDAIAGGPAAAQLDAPLLLTRPDELPGVTQAEIQRLAPNQIVVLGGPASISDAVLNQLAPLAPGGAMRVSGADRYETAAAISAAFFPAASIVVIASGSNFPDALAGGPAAAYFDAPLLLVRPNEIPLATRTELQRLAPSHIVLLGGVGAVSAAVESELATFASGTTGRLGGADRYATAAAISAVFPATPSVMLASGANFPDALAGGPAAALLAGPLLLVQGSVMPESTRAALARLRAMRVPVLGGPAAVGETVLQQARSALGIP
jgi:putative cell wall-binding protein